MPGASAHRRYYTLVAVPSTWYFGSRTHRLNVEDQIAAERRARDQKSRDANKSAFDDMVKRLEQDRDYLDNGNVLLFQNEVRSLREELEHGDDNKLVSKLEAGEPIDSVTKQALSSLTTEVSHFGIVCMDFNAPDLEVQRKACDQEARYFVKPALDTAISDLRSLSDKAFETQ